MAAMCEANGRRCTCAAPSSRVDATSERRKDGTWTKGQAATPDARLNRASARLPMIIAKQQPIAKTTPARARL